MRNLICLSVGHKVNRNRVWNDSLNFRTKCVRCDTLLIRVSHRWVEFDGDAHENPSREAHPHHH